MTRGEEGLDGPSQAVAVIVDLFRDGDRGAAREVRTKVARILAFRGYGIPREDRLDLEQSIMTQLWQSVGRPGFEPGGFWGFVEVVASRRCIDWRRARREETALENVSEPSDPRPSPLGQVLEKEELRRAQAVLAKLPRACRDLIRLHAGQNRSYREIAEILGSSEATLRVQMHRCIKRARLMLQEMSNSGR